MKLTPALKKTAHSYNSEVNYHSKKFDSLGVRSDDIKSVFRFDTLKEPQVLEIGCRNGRDASYIIPYSKSYIGLDISSELLTIARKKVPGGDFRLENILESRFEPDAFTIIFAFASLIHLNKKELTNVLRRAVSWLKTGGLFYISMIRGVHQRSEKKDPGGGIRIFYPYAREDLKEILPGEFEIVSSTSPVVRDVEWLEVLLRKR